MTAEVLNFGNRQKFLPILRVGEWKDSAPVWLIGSRYADLRQGMDGHSYQELVRTLHGMRPEIPALGISWLVESDKAAQYLFDHHSEAHRGAILWYHNVTAVFGNDGYTSLHEDNEPGKAASRRSQDEVQCVRRKLTELNIVELGFGTSSCGYTWVLLARTDSVKELNDLVWHCYPEGGSNNSVQQDVAFTRLWTYWTTPFFSQTIVFEKEYSSD